MWRRASWARSWSTTWRTTSPSSRRTRWRANRSSSWCTARATRAFPAHAPDLPDCYRDTGHPVLIPGDMGTASYVLVGTQQGMEQTFGSTCHGAGRVLSRKGAIKRARGRSIREELAQRGIVVRSRGRSTLAEEMPEAYKDVDAVVAAVEGAGISRRVARLMPLAVIKG